MDYFTIEVGARAVACFRSENSDDAKHFFEAEDFRDDLKILQSEGAPVWDGVSKLGLRRATAEEASEVENAYEFDDDPERTVDDEFVVFLIPISDISDEDDDIEP
ncbi:hypothetical protein [Rhizobium sp. Root1220]|uniref:hypothetical protein n=1 Tax=Rhizobium sp. Root1220 TaxID=1736432 RepID=UPI0006FC64C7|nr:hypothetical protein [Rhizobium sp. Root1220]KQV66094.1 hypothetical protein ASC90_12880 [Rhizobium sp. Root1220]